MKQRQDGGKRKAERGKNEKPATKVKTQKIQVDVLKNRRKEGGDRNTRPRFEKKNKTKNRIKRKNTRLCIERGQDRKKEKKEERNEKR